MKIELNDQERQALAQIIDIAIRAEGVRVAQNGLHLLAKIQEQPREEPKPKK